MEERCESNGWYTPFPIPSPQSAHLCRISFVFLSFHIIHNGRQLRPAGTLNAADSTVLSSWCLLLPLLQVLIGQWCHSCSLKKKKGILAGVSKREQYMLKWPKQAICDWSNSRYKSFRLNLPRHQRRAEARTRKWVNQSLIEQTKKVRFVS